MSFRENSQKDPSELLISLLFGNYENTPRQASSQCPRRTSPCQRVSVLLLTHCYETSSDRHDKNLRSIHLKRWTRAWQFVIPTLARPTALSSSLKEQGEGFSSCWENWGALLEFHRSAGYLDKWRKVEGRFCIIPNHSKVYGQTILFFYR